MENLQKKHRQEQKDLQSRVTQKRKSATKKTRKSVNDECAELEKQLSARQDAEIASIVGGKPQPNAEENEVNSIEKEEILAPLEKPGNVNTSLSAISVSYPAASDTKPKKPNRQKARLARRDAEKKAVAEKAEIKAAELPNLREEEREIMREAYISKGLEEHEIRADGHCLYSAVADQLEHSHIGLKPRIDLSTVGEDAFSNSEIAGYKVTRQVAAAYIFQNSDDFLPFLEEPLEDYVKRVKDTGEWGGHLEILALAKAYGVDINVLQGDGKVEKIECGVNKMPTALWLAYYRHSFGLGEHYNSLRRAP